MPTRPLAAVSAACIALAVAAQAIPAGPATAATPLCGAMAGTAPHISKVLWIAMENESYGTGPKAIPGDPSASYIDNSLLSQCGSTSDYHAATHPSYPNYLALTSGSIQDHTTDSLGYFNVPNIFGQVDPSWRSYEEYMPTNCDHYFQTGTDPPSQYYVGRHNPAASYSSLPVGAPTAGDCTTNDEPLGTTTTGALQHDAGAGELPEFSFVTPGLCDDMHAVPTGDTSCPDTVQGGDTWLSKWIPILTSSPDYTSGNLLIDITWDEGRGGSAGEDCINSQAADCIVPDIVISPYTTHVVSSIDLSHYSLLKTTEELLGLPLLGAAADPSTNDMCASFGICPAAGGEAPTAAFTSSCAGLSCTFDGSGSTSPGSAITGYSWAYGDGASGTGATSSHTYAAGGTYPVTLTVTNAAGLTGSVTHQVAVKAGTAPAIAFVGSSGTTANASTETVTVPSSVTAGDDLLLAATGVTTSSLTAPAGWTLVGTEPNPVMSTSVWSRVATAADAGTSVKVTFPAAVKGSVQLLAYSGTDPTSPVDAFTAATDHVDATSATTPAVTVPTTGDWVVSLWSVKSSAVTSWTGPGGATVRNAAIGSGGGQISSLAADGGGPAAAGPAGGLTATADETFSAATTLSVVLAP